MNNFSEVNKTLQKSNRILLTTHERTDGDDLGTVLALKLYLEDLGKICTVCIKGGVPPQLKFLPGSEAVIEDITDTNFDTVIISGCSTFDRVGNPKILNLKATILNFDHHPDNTEYGTVNLVDASKSSVAELVYELFKQNAWPITADIATCLLTGIFTDTGSFMHSNTTDETFRIASQLMSKGARTSTIARHTYRGKNLQGLKAWGKALQNAFLDKENKIIYSVITENDMKELGGLKHSVFEGLVETLNKVPEAKFALFLKQDGNIIKGSLRSDPFKGVDVAKIAQLFGGGGHRWAAGFSIIGQLAKDEVGNWRVMES